MFKGDTCVYINELSFILFSLLAHTCAFFKATFSSSLASMFVKWAQTELDHFQRLFRVHVFSSSSPFSTIASCLQSVREQLTMLKAAGLNMEISFSSNCLASLELARTRTCAMIQKNLADDDFLTLTSVSMKPLNRPNVLSSALFANLESSMKITPNSTLLVTQSAKFMWETVMEFVFDLFPLVSPSFYSDIVTTCGSFFELYTRHVLDLSHDPQMIDRQHFGIFTNVHFLSHTHFPIIRSLLESEKWLARPVPELDQLAARFTALAQILQHSYYQRRALKLVELFYPISKIDHSNNLYPIPDSTQPSDAILKLIRELSGIAQECNAICREGIGAIDMLELCA